MIGVDKKAYAKKAERRSAFIRYSSKGKKQKTRSRF
tara:strand:- start:168 stop:275 length:108 start_codon:yes stop_codon:yes gene_type:complete